MFISKHCLSHKCLATRITKLSGIVLPLMICKDLLSDSKEFVIKNNYLKRSFVFQVFKCLFLMKAKNGQSQQKAKGKFRSSHWLFFFFFFSMPTSYQNLTVVPLFLDFSHDDKVTSKTHYLSLAYTLIKVKWITLKCIQGCLYAKEAHSLTFKDDLIWYCVASHLSFTLQARNLL